MVLPSIWYSKTSNTCLGGIGIGAAGGGASPLPDSAAAVPPVVGRATPASPAALASVAAAPAKLSSTIAATAPRRADGLMPGAIAAAPLQ